MENQTKRGQSSSIHYSEASKIYPADHTPAPVYPYTPTLGRYYTPELHDRQRPAGMSQFLLQCRSEFCINAVSYMNGRAQVQNAVNFLSSAIAETVIALMEDRAGWGGHPGSLQKRSFRQSL
ncbi:uncharacterized protein IAS62_003102 [Cryptococcus decagattii]|uniref:Uncharacterized protein n=1 Tax=Cryptococcus decagattii TaxID=1859122 RepID=A0ABZ2ATK1_9TREE